jgi:hypothetical protein
MPLLKGQFWMCLLVGALIPAVCKAHGDEGTPSLCAGVIQVDSSTVQRWQILPSRMQILIIMPGSAADKAGLRKGDILLEVAGRDIPDGEAFDNLSSRHKIGEAVEVVVLRDGVKHRTTVVLQRRPTLVEIMAMIQKQAEAGDALACFQLGNEYLLGSLPKNPTEAAKWFRKAADLGNPDGLNNLGALYHRGEGVPRDEKESFRCIHKAAELGSPRAQAAIGSAYELGNDLVEKDLTEALRWYRLAAAQGEPNAQDGLGWMYVNGQGVAKDHAAGMKWFRLAAEQNLPAAQYHLFLGYTDGVWVAKDEAEALRWLEKAVDQGYARAQNNLAALYAEGKGLVRDDAKAVLFCCFGPRPTRAIRQRSATWPTCTGMAEG